MSAETATLTITWFDWAKIVLPGIVTGFIAFGAALLAYQFAKRGRKEDILYKERYKSFEAIAGYLFEIIRFNEKSMYSFVTRYEMVEMLADEMRSIYDSFNKLMNDEPNRRNLVLMKSNTRDAYYSTIIQLTNAYKSLELLVDMVEDEHSNGNDFEPAMNNIYSILLELNNMANYCQKEAFKDLELPQR